MKNKKSSKKLSRVETVIVVAIAFFVIAAAYVSAQYSVVPRGGHGADKIVVDVAGSEKTLQQAIDADDFGAGAWTSIGSNIYYNNGNVGVGTTAPAYPFHAVSDKDNVYAGGFTGTTHGLMGSAQSYGIVGYSTAAGGAGILGQSQVNPSYYALLGSDTYAAAFHGPVCIGGVCRSAWPSTQQAIAEDDAAGTFTWTNVAGYCGVGQSYHTHSVTLSRPVLAMRVHGTGNGWGAVCGAWVPGYFALGAHNFGGIGFYSMSTHGFSTPIYSSCVSVNYDSGAKIIRDSTYGFTGLMNRPMGVDHIPSGTTLTYQQWGWTNNCCYVDVVYGDYR